jgi:hypothetical protein
MNENPLILDRRLWSDYLRAHNYLIPPAEAVAAVNQYIHLRDASPEVLAAFSRYFTAYLLLVGIGAAPEYKQTRSAGTA